ncbi:hypothetical protein PSTG_12588 [Puccinia striiformis f. sp. tritici PST-78]|uniref:Uncharacterized protein n=2 Tax=Puccinia striiformis f. sp. tritici TaxID=168172 RepID=A0A0L0V456_9BASI|nr:hypothetical protein PSTG_12588 [Puccinia striiformis f. sp. tritici PST-78]
MIHDSETFEKWINTAVAKKRIYVLLFLDMPHPADKAKDSKKSNLLAKQAAYLQSIKDRKELKRKSDNLSNPEDGDDSEVEIAPEEWNNTNFHMRALLDANPIRKE